MKLKNKILVALAPAAAIATITPIALTSCGGDTTPTSDRTNKISWKATAIVTTGDTFTVEMDLEKELASGQIITGLITSMSGSTGGQILTVPSVVATAKKATVTFKYGIAPRAEGVDTFTVKFTGSTNGKTEWTNSIENMKVTFSE